MAWCGEHGDIEGLDGLMVLAESGGTLIAHPSIPHAVDAAANSARTAT